LSEAALCAEKESRMSIQINVGDHVSSEAPRYQIVPPVYRLVTSWARERAKLIARGMPSANVYFKGLPGGRSLSQLLADKTIWVNFGPNLGYYGETNSVGGKEIAIGSIAYMWGRWTVLGTLIHELAHSNGAAGGASTAAEEALLHCGLGRLSEKQTGTDSKGTPFEPGISG
jgi:hypothetical protein